jgi:hypothetical protein
LRWQNDKEPKEKGEQEMRLWHYKLLPYLPDLQFKGQLREMMLIMRDWRDKGHTNHLLINMVMEYPKNDFVRYFIEYEKEYYARYGKRLDKQWKEFDNFSDDENDNKGKGIFKDWHTKEYLRSNMANLWEKHFMGVGKSRISDDEWETLLRGYKEITGEEYKI